MKVKTGEILACASYPTYNPITYNEDYEEILKMDFDPLFNRAFHATYAPGSSFKMVTLYAAMELGGGRIKPSRLFEYGETVNAPMPGNILAVNVTNGAQVKKGDVLMILEAMKMENEIICPCDGTVASVNVTKGSTVETGAVLCVIG